MSLLAMEERTLKAQTLRKARRVCPPEKRNSGKENESLSVDVLEWYHPTVWACQLKNEKGCATRRFYNSLRILVLSSSMLGVCSNAYAQNYKIAVKMLKCDEGKIYHPTHVNVSLFDSEKVPKIIKTQTDLQKTIKSLNSNPDALQKALDLYSKLQSLVASTPAIARNKSLPTSEYLFNLPSARKVFIFAFDKSEFDLFPYATQEMEVFSKHENIAILNFSSEEDCKGAQ